MPACSPATTPRRTSPTRAGRRRRPAHPPRGHGLDARHNRPSALFRSDLEALLDGLGADTLILTGVSVNNAISSTARDAFARDLPALVVRDLVGATPWEPEELHASYVDTLATWTAEVADSADVLARLGSLQAR